MATPTIQHVAGTDTPAARSGWLRRIALPVFRAFTRRQLLRVARAACLVALLAVGADTARRAAIEGSWSKLITKDREARKIALAVAPTIVIVAIAGNEGGPAPHHFSLRVDQDASDTGDSSRWDENFFDVTVTEGTSTPATRITRTDPRDGVTTRNLDTDQHAANFAYVAEDTGNYYVRVRGTNAAGLSSSWVKYGPFVVTERATTGHQCFVDGDAADDTGNGLSWATAKKTYNAGYNILRTLPAGSAMYVRDCTVTATPSDMASPRSLIAPDPDAVGAVTVTLTGDYKANPAGTGTNGLIVKDLTFVSSSAGNGHVFGTSGTSYGVCAWGVTMGADMGSFAQCSNGTAQRGWSFINCACTATMALAIVFTENMLGFLEWGMDAEPGSSAEHTHRFTSGSANNTYHSFQYCFVGCSNAKTSLRWYGKSNLWSFGCVWERTVYVGFCSGSCADATGTGTTFDNCLFRSFTGQATDFTLTYFSAYNENSVRNCVFDGISIFANEREDVVAAENHSYFTVINNVMNGAIIRFSETLLNDVVNIVIRGNVFSGWSDAAPQIQVRDLVVTTGWDYGDNVHERGSAAEVFRDQNGAGAATDYDFTEYTALGWVSNELRLDTITPDLTTGECDEATVYAHTRSTGPRPFISYNGERYDPDADIPAGAWLDAADAADPVTFTPSFLHTIIGGLVLKTEAA
jgi:hypothetical protein